MKTLAFTRKAEHVVSELKLLSFLLTDGVQIESPLHSVDFLDNINEILRSKFSSTTLDQCMDSAGT